MHFHILELLKKSISSERHTGWLVWEGLLDTPGGWTLPATCVQWAALYPALYPSWDGSGSCCFTTSLSVATVKVVNEVQLPAVWGLAVNEYIPPINLASEWMIREIFEWSNCSPFNLKLFLTTFHYPLILRDTLWTFLCTSKCKFKNSGNGRHLKCILCYVNSRKVIDVLNPIWKDNSFKANF